MAAGREAMRPLVGDIRSAHISIVAPITASAGAASARDGIGGESEDGGGASREKSLENQISDAVK